MPNLAVLLEAYVPDELPGRQNELDEIKKEIQIFKKNNLCSNILLDGVTGSGKSVTVQWLEKKYSDIIFYTNGRDLGGNVLGLLALIGDKRATTYERGYYNAVHKLNEDAKKGKRQIIIIDEINLFTRQDKLAQAMRHIWDKTATPIFAVTNKKFYTSTLPEDIQKTLLFRQIRFEAYTAPELVEILSKRIEMSGYKFKNPDEVARIIAKASFDYGARMAIDLLRSITLEEKKKITSTDLKDLQKRIDRETLDQAIMRMSHTERETLFLIAEQINNNGITSVNTGWVNEYHPSGLSPVWISQIITTLEDDYGYINTEKIAVKGRGRTRRISMSKPMASQICEMHGRAMLSNPQTTLFES